MPVVPEYCPLCQMKDSKLFIRSSDYSVTGEGFDIVKCNHCEFKFTSPVPLLAEITRYYESADYISHTDEGNNLINKVYKVVRGFTLRNKLAIVNKAQPGGGTLLDIGCGTGEFLRVCRTHGWAISGVEPGKQAANRASEKLGVQIQNSIDNLVGYQKFKVITLWHVLEHIHDLHGTMDKLYELLYSDGTLVIALPNAEAFDAHLYKKHWAAYDLPRHLYHFSPDTFGLLAGKHGFEISNTLPMWFDAFYVSLLSEKYRTPAFYMVPAFFNGLRSNMAALFGKGGFSSLIYILRRV